MDGIPAELEPLAFLIGTWAGEGSGHYPTIQSFRYGEEITFRQAPGKPFLRYDQRTWSLDDRRPLHSEMGYWRPKPEGRLEVVLSESTGHAEVLEGSVDGGTIRLATSSIGAATSAKEVRRTERTIDVNGDRLRYGLSMEAVAQAFGPHLDATLTRRA